ncbi:g4722 [Coccomyxa viridis]|uniref:G4722 protein n=1 Tax=Coccomyxa viridis TaxID=1274662 RepID=A0ABP1FQZ5_9CHLO
MELMDWVRAAGTCKASWAVHLKALKALPYELRDISGWELLLKRSREAPSISLSLRGEDTAHNLSLALKLQRPSVELPSVRELPFSGCGTDAFLTVAELCPNIQVLEVQYGWDALPRLPFAPHLRHLILRSKKLHTLVDELQELRFLETLSLQQLWDDVRS